MNESGEVVVIMLLTTAVSRLSAVTGERVARAMIRVFVFAVIIKLPGMKSIASVSSNLETKANILNFKDKNVYIYS
jgi:hypothetical protein